jgi:hypothetical protein
MDVDLEITPEQFDDRQVRRRTTIRSSVGFQNQPVRCVVRMEKLVHQSRLAHPGFADDRHHLTATVAGKPLRAEKLLQLDVAADEARQAAPGSGLKASSRGPGARHLIDWYRIGESLNRHRTEGLRGDVALRQSERVRCRKHGTRLGHLFHATGQMRRLAHDGIVHLQIVADRADDDFTRVESHPDRHLHPVRPLNLVCISGNGLLHPQSR